MLNKEGEGLDKEYQLVLEAVKKATGPEEYASGLINLLHLMSNETSVIARQGSSDLYNTFSEWSQSVNLRALGNPNLRKSVESGGNFSFRSNTLNNHSSPHGSGEWSQDPTDKRNSLDFGGNVCNFVNQRGKSFVEAKMVNGEPYQHEPYSVMQVETAVKGFKNTTS